MYVNIEGIKISFCKKVELDLIYAYCSSCMTDLGRQITFLEASFEEVPLRPFEV